MGSQWVALGCNGFALVCDGLQWVAMGRVVICSGLKVLIYSLFLVSVGVLDLAVGAVLRPERQLRYVGEQEPKGPPRDAWFSRSTVLLDFGGLPEGQLGSESGPRGGPKGAWELPKDQS